MYTEYRNNEEVYALVKWAEDIEKSILLTQDEISGFDEEDPATEDLWEEVENLKRLLGTIQSRIYDVCKPIHDEIAREIARDEYRNLESDGEDAPTRLNIDYGEECPF